MKKCHIINFINFEYLLSKHSKEMSKFDLKYSNGKCAFIGSNSFYTGGIYFSAISSMRSGCDQAHIFAHKDSVQALKSYSPDLIIHNSFDNTFYENFRFSNLSLLDKFDTISIGTCMGKDNYVKHLIKHILQNVKNEKVIYILDADAISFLIQIDVSNQIKKMNHIFIITPNSFEYKFLLKHCINTEDIMKEVEIKCLDYFEKNKISLKLNLLEYISEEYIKICYSNDSLVEILKKIDET